MLDPRLIREKPDAVKESLKARGASFDLDRLIGLDEKRRDVIKAVEAMKNRRNVFSDEIAKLRKSGADAQAQIRDLRALGKQIETLELALRTVEADWELSSLEIPNIPHESVPIGAGDEQNEVVKVWGEKPTFAFQPVPHWDLGERLGILDFKRAAKITGSRFTLYMSHGALLERALINFMLDLHVLEHGYTEVLPPFMVNRESMTGTGQLPKFEDELFKLGDPDYLLIPTAEVPVTNIYRDEILKEGDLPIRYAAYTPCFRKEAGAHGKDTRGLTRQHQFNKVELVKFANPEDSYGQLEGLLLDAEDVGHIPLVSVRPQIESVRRLDQLGANPGAVTLLAHAPFQERRHVQLLADRARVIGGAFELE